jgi:hypothetical protein
MNTTDPFDRVLSARSNNLPVIYRRPRGVTTRFVQHRHAVELLEVTPTRLTEEDIRIHAWL